MDDSDRIGHPARPELLRQLCRNARRYGFPQRAIEHLVETGRIVVWEKGRAIAVSSDRDGMSNFLISGAVLVELVTGNGARVHVLELLAPGEFFSLAPSPPGAPYHLRAVPHPTAEGAPVAVVALWAQDAMRRLMELLPGSGHMALLTTSLIALSRVAEERALLLGMSVEDRLRLIFRRLASRFGRPHPSGDLIDLALSDATIARLVGSTRSTVNRALNDVLIPNDEIARPRHEHVVVRTLAPTVRVIEHAIATGA